jgi:hypothetical protein
VRRPDAAARWPGGPGRRQARATAPGRRDHRVQPGGLLRVADHRAAWARRAARAQGGLARQVCGRAGPRAGGHTAHAHQRLFLLDQAGAHAAAPALRGRRVGEQHGGPAGRQVQPAGSAWSDPSAGLQHHLRQAPGSSQAAPVSSGTQAEGRPTRPPAARSAALMDRPCRSGAMKSRMVEPGSRR